MKLFLSLLAAVVLAGCSSTGTMRNLDTSKPRTVFIEPIEPDTYRLMPSAEIALGRRGYDAVRDPAKASFRFKVGFYNTWSRITMTVRLTDAASGDVVYFGECNNYGVGTTFAAGTARQDCMDSALGRLE